MLNRAQRILVKMAFERDFYRKKGVEFQEWFEDIARLRYRTDFIKNKPNGKLGDLKCDGYLMSSKTIFQCYAPNIMTEKKLIEKIVSDFTGAVKHWKGKMNKWVLVHNGPQLTANVVQKILELKKNYPSILIEDWSKEELLELVCELPIHHIIDIFGEVAIIDKSDIKIKPNKHKSVPVVFISYSHDNEDHKRWVESLAIKLKDNDVKVLFDMWNLQPSDDIPTFMENAINSADFVIVVCSSNYLQKIENREGGVAYEKAILSSKLMKDMKSINIIPIIRNNNINDFALPTFLGSKVAIDFRDEKNFCQNFKNLLHKLNGISNESTLGPNLSEALEMGSKDYNRIIRVHQNNSNEQVQQQVDYVETNLSEDNSLNSKNGWKKYGSWSLTPNDVNDSLILKSGSSVSLPTEKEPIKQLQEGLNKVRSFIRNSTEVVRIIGLAGVGKTRFVQALFEETVGEEPLNHLAVIYSDVSLEPNPTPYFMLEQLIKNEKYSYVVLDNCNDYHYSKLNRLIKATGTKIKLITVEYQLNEELFNMRNVVILRSCESGNLTERSSIATELLARRYPKISHENALRIETFAEGNLRLVLAIAAQFNNDAESLTEFYDEELLDRLIYQVIGEDTDFMKQTEILALVYSCSTKLQDNVESEFSTLGEIIEQSDYDLYRATSKLKERCIVHERGNWRSILPIPIANKLAQKALKNVRVEKVLEVFRNSGNDRLIVSFIHRLSLLHNNNTVNKIVENWLKPGGLYHRFEKVKYFQVKVYEYLVLIKPDLVLEVIKQVFDNPNFDLLDNVNYRRRLTLISCLFHLANKSENFELCCQLLSKLIDFSSPLPESDNATQAILRFFSPTYTAANISIDQRKSKILNLIWTEDSNNRELGFKLLTGALSEPNWDNYNLDIFGAKPTYLSSEVTEQYIIDWYKKFLDLAVSAGTDTNQSIQFSAQKLLSQQFDWMWKYTKLREFLFDVAKKIRDTTFWADGWYVVRKLRILSSIFAGENKENKLRFKKFLEIEEIIKPLTIEEKITAYVLHPSYESRYLDEKFNPEDDTSYQNCEKNLNEISRNLGQEYSKSKRQLKDLGGGLIEPGSKIYLKSFGIGLTIGSDNPVALWNEMLEIYQSIKCESPKPDILCGFIEQIDKSNPKKAREFLDDILNYEFLLNHLIELHSVKIFNEGDFKRCLSIIDNPNIDLAIYSELLFSNEIFKLTKEQNLQIMNKLIEKTNGPLVIVNAIIYKLKHSISTEKWINIEYAKLGIEAAIKVIKNNPGGIREIDSNFVQNCFRKGISKSLINKWFKTLFTIMDSEFQWFFRLSKVVQYTASKYPAMFLERFFDDSIVSRKIREKILISDSDGELFSKIEISELISWCNNSNDPDIFKYVALALLPVEASDDGQLYKLTERARIFLEESPKPAEILECYRIKTQPSSWSGKLTDIMNLRFNAYKELERSSNRDILQAVKELFQNMYRYESEWNKVDSQFEDLDIPGFE